MGWDTGLPQGKRGKVGGLGLNSRRTKDQNGSEGDPLLEGHLQVHNRRDGQDDDDAVGDNVQYCLGYGDVVQAHATTGRQGVTGSGEEDGEDDGEGHEREGSEVDSGAEAFVRVDSVVQNQDSQFR